MRPHASRAQRGERGHSALLGMAAGPPAVAGDQYVHLLCSRCGAGQTLACIYTQRL